MCILSQAMWDATVIVVVLGCGMILGMAALHVLNETDRG